MSYRLRNKLRLVAAFGGKCGICGYVRCHQCFDFHHLDPEDKDGSVLERLNHSWDKTVIEVRKCVMLCRNCHGEVHAGLVQVPDGIRRFDEAFSEPDTLIRRRNKIDWKSITDSKSYTVEQMAITLGLHESVVFKNIKRVGAETRGQLKTRVDDLELLEVVKVKGWTATAKELGVSISTVRKRCGWKTLKVAVPAGYAPTPSVSKTNILLLNYDSKVAPAPGAAPGP